MKVKPIINDSNFPKVQLKQPLFIVRPKPSQTKFQVPSHSRQLSSPTYSSSTHKAIDQCIACLDLQISEELPMPKAFCLRIREHLQTLKLKLNPEQQSYNQNRQQGDPPQTLLRKQSSKFFRGQRTEGYEDSRNKENSLSTDIFSTVKMLKGRSAREEYQLQIQTLKGKIKSMSDRIDEYQRDYHQYGSQIKKVETLLEKQIKEKVELKEEFVKEQKKKKDLACQLRKALSQFEEKRRLMEHQKKALSLCLSERESQIITLYQLLSK